MWKIYVGNLSSRIRELELANEFRAYGLVRSVWIARNPPGYAFVEFDSRQEAYDAIAALDGKHGWRVEMSRRSSGGIKSRSPSRDTRCSDTRCRECGSHGHHSRDCRFRASQSSRRSSSPHSRGRISRDSPKRGRIRSRSRQRADQHNESSARVYDDGPSQKIASSKSPEHDLINPQTDGYHSPKERELSSSPRSGCGRSPDVQKVFQSDGKCSPAVSEPDLSGSSESMNCENSPSPST